MVNSGQPPLTSPSSPHPSAPATLNPWTPGKAPNNPYGVGLAFPLAAKTPALPSSTLPPYVIPAKAGIQGCCGEFVLSFA